MKSSRLFLLALVARVLAACAANPQPEVEVGVQSQELGENALSPAQSKTVLKLVDDICGDTWCEGDYNFAFRKLQCATCTGTCILTLQLLPREGMPDEGKAYTRTCTTRGFTGFDSLVQTSASGYQSLQGNYYSALTECISRLEDEVRSGG